MEKIKTLTLPIIKLEPIKLILFSVLFVALSIALPQVAHYFNLAGTIFLPLHFFALTAGLLLGWSAGLIVGLTTPLMAFVYSGMPPAALLPIMTAEIAGYGLIAGYLREKLRLNIYLSLLIALIGGRAIWFLGLIITASAFTNSLNQIWSAAKLGWPGLLIQLLIIPSLVIGLKKAYEKNRNQSRLN